MRRTLAIAFAWGGLALAGQGWAGEGREAAPSGAASSAAAAQRVDSDAPAIAAIVSSPEPRSAEEKAMAFGTAARAGSGQDKVPMQGDEDRSQDEDASGRDQAWVATYSLRDAHGERTLVVVRTEDRVEYRMQDEPVRVWRRLADGLEYRELRTQQGRVVVYAPGDLRALGQSPDWNQLHQLVAPAVREGLRLRGASTFDDRTAQHLQGEADDVDWLEDVGLPSRYVRRARQGKTTLVLRELERTDAATAFTPTDGLREIDYADLGDMELDAFASQHIRQGFQEE